MLILFFRNLSLMHLLNLKPNDFIFVIRLFIQGISNQFSVVNSVIQLSIIIKLVLSIYFSHFTTKFKSLGLKKFILDFNRDYLGQSTVERC